LSTGCTPCRLSLSTKPSPLQPFLRQQAIPPSFTLVREPRPAPCQVARLRHHGRLAVPIGIPDLTARMGVTDWGQSLGRGVESHPTASGVEWGEPSQSEWSGVGRAIPQGVEWSGESHPTVSGVEWGGPSHREWSGVGRVIAQ